MRGHITALVAIIALTSISLSEAGPPVAPNEPSRSLCDQLADTARSSPESGWNKGESVLRPSLETESPSGKLSPFEAKLTDLPSVKEAISSDGWATFVEHLPSSRIYMAETVQGTLHCQSSVFLEAPRKGAPRIIDPPAHFDEGDLCWSQSGDFGRVLGHPAFIEHGTLNDHTDDEDIRITPWTGKGWGQTCKLGLRFRRQYALTQQFCGDDRSVCSAGQHVAVNVAMAYNEKRAQRDDNSELLFGPPATKEAMYRVVRARNDLAGPTSTPDFPTFGKVTSGEAPNYSYSGFAFFPLALNGSWFVGAIGHDGIGWRESDQTLITIFSAEQNRLQPLASFVVVMSNGGLAKTIVENVPEH